MTYELEVPAFGIKFQVDRLRRERQELIGELAVRCSMPGTRAVNGILNIADFNFSSAPARQTRAKLLKERANTNSDMDWFGLLEEFCQKVFDAEREGQQWVNLRDVPRPPADDAIKVGGFALPRRHPTIFFGDGGTLKSYFLLWILGQLALSGMTVGFFDWELSEEDHRDRLERLFGNNMPEIFYYRCERPLVFETDAIRRIVRDRGVQYAGFDSIVFACGGSPNDPEVAGSYFRAVRSFGCGSAHIAHVTKGEDNDQRPFGSVFFHNSARCTWFIKAADPDPNSLRLGFYNRKANLGPIQPPSSFLVSFGDRTTFERVNISDSPDLASKLTIRQRMYELLRRGSMTVTEIADALDESWDSVNKSVKRNSKHFVLLDGGRVGLRA
jgi:hypothetical protein